MPKNPVTQKFSFWCCSNASAWPFVSFDWNWTYVLFKFNHWSCWDMIQQTPILYILPNLYSCWTLVIFSTLSNSMKATPVSDPIQVSAAIVLCLKILWNKVLSLRLEINSTLLRAWGDWDRDSDGGWSYLPKILHDPAHLPTTSLDVVPSDRHDWCRQTEASSMDVIIIQFWKLGLASVVEIAYYPPLNS